MRIEGIVPALAQTAKNENLIRVRTFEDRVKYINYASVGKPAEADAGLFFEEEKHMGRKLLAGILFVFAAQAASASSFLYTAALNGFQEVPPTGSQAVSVIQLTLDDSLLTATGSGVVVFLSGPVTDFHINNAPFGSNGPVVLDIGPGAFSGNNVNFSATLPDQASFDSLKTLLDAREGYFNIDTSLFPEGEIRGQIAPVPEPTALAVLGIGLVALRRKKRHRV